MSHRKADRSQGTLTQQYAYSDAHYATLCKFGAALRLARNRRRTATTTTFGYAARVIVFGGSMTYGENAEGCPTSKTATDDGNAAKPTKQTPVSGCAWPALLQHWFDQVYGAGTVEVINMASRGKTIAWLGHNANQLVSGMVAKGTPTLFLIDFSINDALGINGYKSNTSHLVQAGRAAVAKLAPLGGVVLVQTYNSSCRTGQQEKKDRLAAGLGKCPTYSMPDGYQQISTGIPGFPMPLWHFNLVEPLTVPHPGWPYHTKLAESIGFVLAATDACMPGNATAAAATSYDAAAGKRLGSKIVEETMWRDTDSGSQSSLASLNAIGAAAGLELTMMKDGTASFMGDAGTDDCDKANVEMVTAVNGMQLIPHSDDGPWEPLGYGVPHSTKGEHSWLVSNVDVPAADHAAGTGTPFHGDGGGSGGWLLLELRQGKPGWISEERADHAASTSIADGEPGKPQQRLRHPTLQFVPPKFKWMMNGLRPMRLYVEFMKTYENAGQAEVWYCGGMVAVLDALWKDRFSLAYGESIILPPCAESMHRNEKAGKSWNDMKRDNPLGRVEFRWRRASVVQAAREQEHAAGKVDVDHSSTGTAKFKLISVALCTVT